MYIKKIYVKLLYCHVSSYSHEPNHYINMLPISIYISLYFLSVYNKRRMVESDSESSMSSMIEIGSESSMESIDEIERELLIEKEPRTLSSDQLQFARDAALHVMKTRSGEEAMRIFTKGLQPVGSGSMSNRGALMDLGEEWVDELRSPLMYLGEKWIDEPRISEELREIVTAPF